MMVKYAHRQADNSIIYSTCQQGGVCLNTEIREEARRWRVPLWEIAQQLGVSESTMTRWMRTELSTERVSQIRAAIKAVVEGRGRKS